MAPDLPVRPDLEFEQKQAKALLRAVRSQLAEACTRVRAHAAKFSQATDASMADAITLADAQFVIARERGFPTWIALRTHIEAATPLATLAERFLEAIRVDRFAVARRLSREHEALSGHSIHSAAAGGDLAAVWRWLSHDPALASATHSSWKWTPLGYACWSHAFEASARAAEDNVAIVRALLDAGADPNQPVYSQDPQPAKLPVLYLAGRSHQPAIVKLLLERGAATNDGESIYHMAQDGHVDCLDMLLARGADITNRHSEWGNTPLYFLAGHAYDAGGHAPWLRGFRWLLEHGADPNITSYKSQETPLHQIARIGTSVAAASLLLEYGADPLAKRSDGRTPYDFAVRSGATGIARLLEQRMTVTPELTVMDRFIGACLTADAVGARTLLASHPDLISTMEPVDVGAVTRAAASGLSDALRLMASLGFDLSSESPDAGTPLHWAAWHGRVDAVRTLLDIGVPIDIRDKQYGSSPVAWAAHGSRYCRSSDHEYTAIVEMLLDRHPDYAASINKWGEPPNSMGSRAVSAVFKRRAFGGAQAIPPIDDDGDASDD